MDEFISKKKERRLRARARELAKEKKEITVEKPAEAVTEAKPEKLGKKGSIKDFYDKKYKKLLIIPFAILFLSIIFISWQYAVTGDFIHRDVSLKGGITLTVSTGQQIDTDELSTYIIDKFPGSDVSIRILKSAGVQTGIIIEAAGIDAAELAEEIKSKLGVNEEDYSLEEMGGSLGASFFKDTVRALVIAFIFMAFVVFVYFRVPAPSLAVVLSALSDIIITLAIVNLFGIKLSTAGIAAFLMIIGYSVDTDILLSTRVLKRKEGTVINRILGAMGTGLTMTGTTFAAILVAFIFSQSVVLKQIMLILMIGLIVDLMNTWIQNVGLLRLYLDRKARKGQT